MRTLLSGRRLVGAVSIATLTGLILWLGQRHPFYTLAVLALSAVTIAAGLLVPAILRALFRRPQRWSLPAYAPLCHALAHGLLTVPLLLASLLAMGPRTRGDERDWPGPRIDSGGAWQPWTREELARDKLAGRLPSVSPAAVELQASDGVPLRAFYVAATGPARRGIGVVLTHGFFRSGMELEPVAALLHAEGADVLLVELRNHGGSARAPFGAGVDERLDVRAGIDWLAGKTGRAPIAMGVSLGGGATLFAVGDGAVTAGLWLDAPLVEAGPAARRQLTTGRRNLLPPAVAEIALHAGRLLTGLDVDHVRPIEAAAQIPAQPIMIVAGGRDRLIDISEIMRLYSALPGQPEVWLLPEAGHGDAWKDAREQYIERWRGFLDQVQSAAAPPR